jgi:hypothetical protein
MISWMEHTLGFSRVVATKLYWGQLLKTWKEFADVGDDDIDRVIAVIRRDLKESIAEIAVSQLKLVIYWVEYQVRTNHSSHVGKLTVTSAKSRQGTSSHCRIRRRLSTPGST